MLSSLACRPPLLDRARGRTMHLASVCSLGRDGGTFNSDSVRDCRERLFQLDSGDCSVWSYPGRNGAALKDGRT